MPDHRLANKEKLLWNVECFPCLSWNGRDDIELDTRHRWVMVWETGRRWSDHENGSCIWGNKVHLLQKEKLQEQPPSDAPLLSGSGSSPPYVQGNNYMKC